MINIYATREQLQACLLPCVFRGGDSVYADVSGSVPWALPTKELLQTSALSRGELCKALRRA